MQWDKVKNVLIGILLAVNLFLLGNLGFRLWQNYSRASGLEWVFKLNPFYYIAAGYRDSMLTGSWFFERPTMTIYFWVVTFILMIIGLKVFKKLRPHFSDVL